MKKQIQITMANPTNRANYLVGECIGEWLAQSFELELVSVENGAAVYDAKGDFYTPEKVVNRINDAVIYEGDCWSDGDTTVVCKYEQESAFVIKAVVI
ncbi:MAG: hypothetical protein ACRC2N_09410 [Aeromonas sp.]